LDLVHEGLEKMETEKVHLTKEKETYLVTLYGKALDSRSKKPILGDQFADEVVRHIDFDFEKLRVPKGAEITLPMRAKHLDQWTREFLSANPVSTVLHLGCGLDSRVFRIDPPATVRWYDVDYPDVIEMRRRLYPQRQNYSMIGSSVTDLHWLDGIPVDRPVLVVAEGLVQYLPEREGIALFNRITEKFLCGEFIFDAYSRLTVRLITLLTVSRAARVFLPWAVNNPHKLEKQVPRLKLVTSISFLFMPELVERLSQSQSWIQRVMYYTMGHFSFMRKSIQHLRYRF
jgi:O-methyltransferase involved in polyketide biosynthesis